MSFNAGGTNVRGTEQSESGEFKIERILTTFTGTGNETKTVTVPAGKTYILKGLFTGSAPFVGTVSGVNFYVTDGTNFVPIYSGGAGTVHQLFLSQPFTLPAGFSLQIKVTISAYTSGQINCDFLFQEITN